MNRYFLVALTAITAAHAFSSFHSNTKIKAVPQPSSSPSPAAASWNYSNNYLSGLHLHRRNRNRRNIFSSSTCAAAREDGSSANSIFEQMFRIQLPWEESNWQWQWPNNSKSNSESETSSSSSSIPTDTSKSSSSSSHRIGERKHTPPEYDTMTPRSINYNSNTNNPPRDLNTNANTVNVVGEMKSMKTLFRPTNEQNVHSEEPSHNNTNNTRRQPKLGILLIDHGSKRKASNEHLHSMAQSYQTMLLLWDSSNTAKNSINSQVLVRAAHMEIAAPSIETQLRQLITQEKVTHAICVPYFLSPGKHATIDVPNLIREAQSRLDEEGLLEYYDGDGNADGKRRMVEIYTTKSVGSHVDCMLNVVNDLVRVALEETDDGGDSIIFQRLGTHLVHRQAYKGQSSPDTERTHGSTNDTNEVQRYSNRAALLENVLQLNTKQLKTMTNRAMLMENAMKKVQFKWKKEKEDICEARDKQENIFVEQVANLTATIEASNLEKETMIQSFEIQRINMEREYNTTIGDLESKVKSMEQELTRIVDDNRRAELLRTEERKPYNLEEEELEEKCRQQQLQIQELQTKLTDLLDAHIQLEQLQDDTESALHDQQDKLRELNVTYESTVEVEQEEKEIFRIKWMDAQRQLELESARLHRMLNETTSQYEALLEEERGKAHEWKGKWEAMNDEQSRLGNLESSSNSTDDQPNASTAIEQQLKEAATFKADAIDRIQALEEELSQQKEQYESSSVRNEEQQQQLQKYLRAQLSTYYETIQSQVLQIRNYEEQISDMSQRHNESMLIATSSVEASQRREENLLTNIEELENELLIARSEMDSRQNELSDLQTRLHKMEDLRLQSDNMLEKRNDELTAKIELLERKVIAVTQQKDQALAENISIVLEKSEMFGKADLDASSSPSLSNNPQHQRFKWVRVIFRPLALFRRKRDVR